MDLPSFNRRVSNSILKLLIYINFITSMLPQHNAQSNYDGISHVDLPKNASITKKNHGDRAFSQNNKHDR